MGIENYIYAADTVNMQAGGKSFFERAKDAVVLGGGAAAISGLQSIYNTGVDAVNFFGADIDRIDTAKFINNIDRDWGKYYVENKDTIDTIGFIGTAFIPGGLAVKGLNMLRRGESVGAFGRALNFATTRQTANLEKAMQTLASPEGSVFTRMNKNYLQSLGWGAADNVLQSAVFEVAVASTMNASPLLDGQNHWDMVKDIATMSLVGGAFGGAVEGFITNRILKDASKEIGKAQRKYDTLGAFEKLNLQSSDKAYSFIDAAMNLPKEIFTDDKVLNFAYRLNGQQHNVALDTSSLLSKSLERTVKNAYNDFERIITTQLADDTTVGKPLAKSLLELLAEGKAANKADDELRSRLGDFVFDLQKVEGVGDQLPLLRDDTLFYFDKKATIANGSPFSRTPPKVGEAQTFRIAGDPGQLRIAVLGHDANSVKEAFEQGFDSVMKPDGTFTINPKSGKIRKVKEPTTNALFFNTLTRQTSDEAVLNIADVATKESPLVVTAKGVTSGDRHFKFELAKPVEAGDNIAASARHLWAAGLKKVEGVVDAKDISVLDAMSKNKSIVADDTIISVDGIEMNWRDLGNFDEFVFNNKIQLLKNRLNAGEVDIQAIAMELNTTPQWVQNAIASNFDAKLKKFADGAPDLTDGWQRDLTSHGTRENLILHYAKQPALLMDDFGNTFARRRDIPMVDETGKTFLADVEGHRSFVTGELAYQYRKKLAIDRLDTTFHSVFGEDAGKFLPFTAQELSGLADSTGAGASLTGFSNANYGDKLRLWSQETGKQTHLLAQKITNANLSRLQGHLALIKNTPKAAAELTAVVTRLRRSSEKYQLLGVEHGLDGAYLVDKSLVKLSSPETLAAIKEAALSSTQGDMKAFKIVNQEVADFLKEHHAITSELVGKKKALFSAQGIASNLSEDTLYVPAIDTRKVPYFAFVRPKEGKIFGTSDVSMITARSDAELLQLASQIPEKEFDVIFKKDTERFFKAKGDYEYSRSLNESAVDSSLKKEGKLGDFLPSFNVEDVLEDFVNYHQRQATSLVRDGVATKYAQTFAEIQRLSEQYTLAATSKMEPIGKLFNRTVKDPYDDYLKGALDISKRSEFTLLHQTNEFVDALGVRAYRAVEDGFKKAAKGTISWDEANDMLTHYGLGQVFETKTAFELAKTPADRNLLKTGIQKANLILSTVVLRFDFANSLINIISTPILLGTEMSAIRNSIKKDPELVGQLAELTSVKVPGQEAALPTTKKLLYQAVRNFWGKDKNTLLKRYEENGDIRGVMAMYHEMVDDLSLTPKLIPSKYAEKADKWTERIATGTLNNFSEQFTRFVSADVMRQLTDPLVKAGKMGVQEQNAFISIFVNRVQGNYISSQRPILFQGTLGAAIGLFQTYQFNLLQQLFRHIGDRNTKAIATMGGLQTSVFGLNGLPLFEAINTHIVGNASMNDGHRDAYSLATQAAGKEMGDWLMYGTASALPIFGGKGPSLYTRGDLNPRHVSIVPVTPMDVPAVEGTVRFVTNLINTGKNIAGGADVTTALLEGLEHNGLNRPLAGLAQALQGYSTTSKGSLVAANLDMFSIANAGRILGAKPLDESVALNTRFRLKAYEANSREKMTALGEIIKSKVRGNNDITDEEMINFMGRYAASGGRIENFSKQLQRWTRDANSSIANQLADKVNTPYGQRFVEVMGGDRLDDFYESDAN